MFNCVSSLRVEKSPFQLLSTASASFDSRLIILSKASSGKVSTPTPCRLLQLHSRDDCAIYSRRSSGKLQFNSFRMLQLLRLQLHHLFEAFESWSFTSLPVDSSASFESQLESNLRKPPSGSSHSPTSRQHCSSNRVDSLRMLSSQSPNSFANCIHVLAFWRR